MIITCPNPAISNKDIITLAHGGGGSMTHRLLQETIFSILGNPWLDRQHDGAFLDFEGPVAFSTDSYVITPIFFPGGDIGELAVYGTVNDLAMCGAHARYLSLSFIIEEGLPLADFRRVVESIHKAAVRTGTDIVTGDTKVVEKGKGDKLFINTSGLGYVLPGACIHHRHVEPGDVLIISGNLATHGIAIMSQRQGLQFETSIVSDTRPLFDAVDTLIGEFRDKIKFLRDPTRGGLASILNELAGSTDLGLLLHETALPIDPEVEGACEMLGLDPLYVANEGIFLAVVKPEIADAVVQLLRARPDGSRAAIIGEVTTAHPGTVVLKSTAGGHRILNPIPGEQLPRIC